MESWSVNRKCTRNREIDKYIQTEEQKGNKPPNLCRTIDSNISSAAWNVVLSRVLPAVTQLHTYNHARGLIIIHVLRRYGDSAGNTTEKNRTLASSPQSECASCLQCFDTVSWVAGRASGL